MSSNASPPEQPDAANIELRVPRDVGFGPVIDGDNTEVPSGWTVHPEFKYYTLHEHGRALFTNPGQLKAVLGENYDLEDCNPAPAWDQETLAVLETLPAKEHGFIKIAGDLFSACALPDRMRCLMEAKRDLGRLCATLNLARKFSDTGDSANALKCRQKITGIVPGCVREAKSLMDCEKFDEAVDHLRICAVLYLTGGSRFSLHAGQIMQQISFCLLKTKDFRACLRTAEHALYMYIVCPEEVDWAFASVINVMAQCYRAMELPSMALTHYIYCFQASEQYASPATSKKLESCVNEYEAGSLLWMPRVDGAFHADKALCIGLCLLSMGEKDNALEFFTKGLNLYIKTNNAILSHSAFAAVAETCYDNDMYETSARFSEAAYNISKVTNNLKYQAFDLMYMAHGHAMSLRVRDAIEAFELLYKLPASSRCKQNEVSNILMFADCLQSDMQTSKAMKMLAAIKKDLHTEQNKAWFNVIMAACFADKGNLAEANKCIIIARHCGNEFIRNKKTQVLQLISNITLRLDQQALQATRELCPGFNPESKKTKKRNALPKVASSIPDEGEVAFVPQWEERECCVCLAAVALIAFSPCFHQCVCVACSQSIMENARECPICRTKSDAANAILDDGAPCAHCCALPPTVAVTPCFHMAFCEACALCAPLKECPTCGGDAHGRQKIFT